MIEASYGGVIEDWKVHLIAQCGRRMGLQDADIEDAMQEIVPHMIEFRYDAARSNGATERTALTSLVKRQLFAIRRREARYANCLERAKEEKASAHPVDEATQEPFYEDLVPLATDLRAALDQLSEQDRRICDMLSHGNSVQQIADELDCDWHTVDRRIERIRERFTEWGLNGWLGHK